MATGSQINVDLAFLDQSRQDLQIVKCVVVGDTGVGKTRLTCAHACGTKYNLQKLTQTHVSTVWAIDHYRKDREILDRSWCCVDGMNVSLRIWDTFGYHDKDRRFAYGRADVVLLCFSLVRPRTLTSVTNHWVPEIRRLCGPIPIVLCGCQADLRYLYNDPTFIKLEKSPFFREILEKDIITPDKGRAVAKEIGAAYYETSVLEQYGVQDVFMNSIRASLCSKRERHFWNMLGGLKHIRHPLAQPPLCPPKPTLSPIVIPPLQLEKNYENLLNNQCYCDVIFVVRGVCLQAHRSCLIISAAVFRELFLTDLTAISSTTENRNANSAPCGTSWTNNGKSDDKKDTAGLLDNEETASLWSLNTADSGSSMKSGLPRRELNHAAFKRIELQECEDMYHPGSMVLQTVVTVCEEISPQAFQEVLAYLYTGRCTENAELIKEVRKAAELIGLHELFATCSNVLQNESFLNSELGIKFQRDRMHNMKELLINKGLLSDVLFQLEDGEVSAHKALLMACCDMMFAMFGYNFRESSAKTVHFPGVSCAAFRTLQDYLYTGNLSICGNGDQSLALELIEVSNRLCLPRLMLLTEQGLIRVLTKEEESGRDIAEDVLSFLEQAQLHNAKHLSEFCTWYIRCNFSTVYSKYAKVIGKLRPENQIYLHRNRWPPLWYLKEMDHYERCQIDEQRERPRRMSPRRGSDDQDSGCLGFCSRRNRRFKDVTNQAAVATM